MLALDDVLPTDPGRVWFTYSQMTTSARMGQWERQLLAEGWLPDGAGTWWSLRNIRLSGYDLLHGG